VDEARNVEEDATEDAGDDVVEEEGGVAGGNCPGLVHVRIADSLISFNGETDGEEYRTCEGKVTDTFADSVNHHQFFSEFQIRE